VCAVVLEAVEILVPLAAHLAAVWLFLLHAHGARVRYRCEGVDDRKCAVLVLLQLLVLVTVLRVC
jgi:hypothetical protein